MQQLFCELVGSFGQRGKILPEILLALKDIRSNPNVDIIPQQAWGLFIKPEKTLIGLGWREVSKLIGVSYCGSTLFKSGLSRERMLRVANSLNSQLLQN